MSDLVVDLSDPADVADALMILTAIHGGDWPDPPITSGVSASRNGGEVGGSASASADRTSGPHTPRSADELPPWESSESDSKTVDDDPWASGAKMPETPRAARSEPATSNQAGAAALTDDDDNPWS